MATSKDETMTDDSISEGSFSGFDSDDEPQANQSKNALFEKDSDEEELERLVLGNGAGFRENLLNGGNDGLDGAYGAETQTAEGDDDMENIEDNDLFAFDSGISGAPGAVIPKPTTQTTEKTPAGDPPAWEDSDDERLAISLAGATRLRKLRVTEAEDIVSGTEYARRLRNQFLQLNPMPAWATPSDKTRPTKRRRRSSAATGDDSSASSDSDGDIEALPLQSFLRNANKLAGRDDSSQGQKRRLRPEIIDIQRTREIPDRHKGAVDSLSFHPEYPVLLSSSPASVLYLHHISPEAHPTPNPQLTSVQVKNVDVRRAEFLYPKGDKIFFAGRRRYFHHWDLPSGVVQKTTQIQGHKLEHKSMERFRLSPCGRYMAIVASSKKGGGIINVLSTASLQWITSARLSSQHGIADFAWWSTGDGMTILGRDGQVGEYSMESQAFLGIWVDEGCVGGVVISLGGHQGPSALGDDRWVAVGSNSGITNIYDRQTLLVPGDEVAIKERPSPTRTLEQLVTPITTLAFSPDGQLLAVASQHKKDALRLVHLPSCTVYRNWPTQQTPLGRVTTVAFSRQSDILAVGNDSGKIRMWHILS